jgi:hypothetical protein
MATRAEKTLRVRVCPSTVGRDDATTFSNQIRKGPSCEEEHKAMVSKISNVTGACIPQNAQTGKLRRVWAEIDYRLDVCCVTKGEYIEHL